MNYRQWKKNYKKRYGVNPPITVDKRKQRKLAKKVVENLDLSMLVSSMSQVAANIGTALKEWIANVYAGLGNAFTGMGKVFTEMGESVRDNM